MGLGHVFALLALDEADRAQRIAEARRQPHQDLDPSRSETRASAWRRWRARHEADAQPSRVDGSAPRRAAHV
jgi:hypothetical protein